MATEAPLTYTATCPDPECATVFEVEEDELDLDTDEPGEFITCPNCGQDCEWDFDADHDPPLTLTGIVEYEEDEEADEEEEDEEETNGD